MPLDSEAKRGQCNEHLPLGCKERACLFAEIVAVEGEMDGGGEGSLERFESSPLSGFPLQAFALETFTLQTVAIVGSGGEGGGVGRRDRRRLGAISVAGGERHENEERGEEGAEAQGHDEARVRGRWMGMKASGHIAVVRTVRRAFDRRRASIVHDVAQPHLTGISDRQRVAIARLRNRACQA